MATTIRLARHGRNKLPFYRVVVTDKENKRDGRYIELLGTVDPLKNPALINLKEERIKHWVGVGALPSDTVASYISKEIPGFLEEIEKEKNEKIQSKRAKRKAKASGKKEKSAAKVKRRSRKDREKPVQETKKAEEEEAKPEAKAEEKAPEAKAEESKPAEAKKAEKKEEVKKEDAPAEEKAE